MSTTCLEDGTSLTKPFHKYKVLPLVEEGHLPVPRGGFWVLGLNLLASFNRFNREVLERGKVIVILLRESSCKLGFPPPVGAFTICGSWALGSTYSYSG